MGPDLVGPFLLLTILAGWGLEKWMRDGDGPGSSTVLTDPIDAAGLAGGATRATQVVLAQLWRCGALRVDPANRSVHVSLALCAAPHPLAARTLEALGGSVAGAGPGAFKVAQGVVRQHRATLNRRLHGQGWIPDPARYRVARVLQGVLGLALGVQGLRHAADAGTDAGAVFVLALLLLGAGASFGYGIFRRVAPNPSGVEVLQQARSRLRPLAQVGANDPELDWHLALLGIGALAAAMPSALIGLLDPNHGGPALGGESGWFLDG